MTLDGCYTLSQDAQLTVSNLAGAGENCYITISLYTSFEYNGACYLDQMYALPLTNNAGFILGMNGATTSPEYGGAVELRPGESVTFSLSEYAAAYDVETGEEVFKYDFLTLSLGLHYPDVGEYGTTYTAYYCFVY